MLQERIGMPPFAYRTGDLFSCALAQPSGTDCWCIPAQHIMQWHCCASLSPTSRELFRRASTLAPLVPASALGRLRPFSVQSETPPQNEVRTLVVRLASHRATLKTRSLSNGALLSSAGAGCAMYRVKRGNTSRIYAQPSTWSPPREFSRNVACDLPHGASSPDQ